ncbi:hypothetical protein V3C99_014252 [Haemonchus contortus]
MMKLHIISVMCCVLLVAQGHSDENCKNNVDPSIQGDLIEVLNKKCSSFKGSRAKFNNDSYSCELGEKAHKGEPSGPSGLYSFDGRSTYIGNWRSALTEAVNDANKVDPSTYLPRVMVMCGLDVKKIGCSIDPKTTRPETPQQLRLRCNYKL